jgi:hypothetical protein
METARLRSSRIGNSAHGLRPSTHCPPPAVLAAYAHQVIRLTGAHRALAQDNLFHFLHGQPDLREPFRQRRPLRPTGTPSRRRFWLRFAEFLASGRFRSPLPHLGNRARQGRRPLFARLVALRVG